MTVLLLWLLACGGEPKPLTSKPTPPTADLQGTLPEQTAWSDLEGFFPETPGIPLATPGLALGMPLDTAKKRLDALALGRVVSREIDDREVHTATLRVPPEAAVAIVSDPAKEVVAELQYTLPADQAERAIIQQWGVPSGFTLEEEPSYFWSDDQQQIQWVTVAGKSTGILIYTRPDPPTVP